MGNDSETVKVEKKKALLRELILMESLLATTSLA